MARVERVIFTNMCMIQDNEGNVVVQDRIHSDWPGIAFPGGHVEVGESFTHAVIREVYEETGLKVSQLQMCGIKDWVQEDRVRYVVLLYKTHVFQGALTSSEEGPVWWAPLWKLSNMNLADGMDTMLRLFCEEELSEQFFHQKDGGWMEVLQ